MDIDNSKALHRTVKLANSWEFCIPDFREDYGNLVFTGALQEEGPGEIIWSTRNKFVLKITAPSGRTVVYKSFRKIKFLPYLFRLSPLGREALNYCKLQELGFPLPELLAAGEERHFFKISGGFVITEFASGTANGREFIPGGNQGSAVAARNEFIRQSMTMLRKLHDYGISHGGFTPANVLWKGDTAETLQTVWIDIATCRKSSKVFSKKRFFKDFYDFFRFFNFTKAELEQYLQFYFSSNGPCFTTLKKAHISLVRALDAK